MTLQQLRYAAAVVDTGTISRELLHPNDFGHGRGQKRKTDLMYPTACQDCTTSYSKIITKRRIWYRYQIFA